MKRRMCIGEQLVQSGDDEVQQLNKEVLKSRSEIDVVKTRLARISEVRGG